MVHFTTARELFDKLRRSTSADVQFRRLTANRAKLLIIDEIGYEPLDHLAATHFFRLICERYERGSMVLTSNKRFSEWGQLIGDETLAAAILDGLLHHATTISITGDSYRLKEKRRAGILAAAPTKGRPLGLALVTKASGELLTGESGEFIAGVDNHRGLAARLQRVPAS